MPFVASYPKLDFLFYNGSAAAVLRGSPVCHETGGATALVTVDAPPRDTVDEGQDVTMPMPSITNGTEALNYCCVGIALEPIAIGAFGLVRVYGVVPARIATTTVFADGDAYAVIDGALLDGVTPSESQPIIARQLGTRDKVVAGDLNYVFVNCLGDLHTIGGAVATNWLDAVAE